MYIYLFKKLPIVMPYHTPHQQYGRASVPLHFPALGIVFLFVPILVGVMRYLRVGFNLPATNKHLFTRLFAIYICCSKWLLKSLIELYVIE